jgi:RNA polymerase sigma-70 factor (ECF subfamily)
VATFFIASSSSSPNVGLATFYSDEQARLPRRRPALLCFGHPTRKKAHPMADSDEKADGGKWFDTTRWSVVLAAGDSANPDFGEALSDLCRTYWYPVYAYFRRRGADAESAQDLAQGFFSDLLEKKALSVARPERGRFRSFLLTSAQNYMINTWHRDRAKKRGGGESPLPLDFDTAESRYRVEPGHDETPDKAFERRWALALLDRVLERLVQEMGQASGSERVRLLSRFLTGVQPDLSYREAGERLNMSESAVKVAVHRMRKRYGQLLREEVRQTVDDPAQVDDEIRYLFAVMES